MLLHWGLGMAGWAQPFWKADQTGQYHWVMCWARNMRSYISSPLLVVNAGSCQANNLPVLPSPSPFSMAVYQDCPAGQSNISDSVFLKVWISKKTLNCFRIPLPPPFWQQWLGEVLNNQLEQRFLHTLLANPSDVLAVQFSHYPVVTDTINNQQKWQTLTMAKCYPDHKTQTESTKKCSTF